MLPFEPGRVYELQGIRVCVCVCVVTIQLICIYFSLCECVCLLGFSVCFVCFFIYFVIELNSFARFEVRQFNLFAFDLPNIMKCFNFKLN